MMKVLILPNYEHNPYQELLANGLRDSDCEVIVDGFSTKWPILLRSAAKHRGISVIHIHWLYQYLDWFFASDSRPLRQFKKVLFYLDLALVRLAGYVVVWTIHNEFSHDMDRVEFEKFFCRRLYRFSNRVIVHCPSVIQQLKESYGLSDERKFCTVPHGHYIRKYANSVSRAEARERLQLSNEAHVVLFFGNIKPYKGVDRLIEIFNRIESPGVILLLVGNVITPDYERQLRDQIKSPQIRTFFWSVADEEVQIYMNAADVCVFPFKRILTSGSVILAMSFRRAVIVPRQGCLVDLLSNGGAFFFNGYEELGEAIDLSARANCWEMGEYNYETVLKNSWESVGKKLKEVYEGAKRERSGGISR